MQWIRVKLTDVANPKQWKNLPVSKFKETGYPVYGANGVIGCFSEYNHENPTIAITCRGATCGSINITSPKSYITSNAMALDDLDTSRIDINFLVYALKHRGFRDVISGAAQPQITRKNLETVRIKIPEKHEDQIRIATLLSHVEELIAKRKESIRLLDELLKSTFLEMFGDPVRNEKGWETYKGNDYSELLTVGVVVKPASYYTEKGIIALRSLNIKPNHIDLNKLVYFSEETSNGVLAKSVLRQGDVVIVRTGLTGTAAVVPRELDGANCIDLIIVRPKKNTLNPFYLVFLLNSERGKRLVSSKEVGGIQKHFNIGTINKIAFPLPPLPLQTQFAQIVQKTESLKSKYQSSLYELENLYGSLSQRAFRGELDLSKVPVNHKLEVHNVVSSSHVTSPTLSVEKTEKFDLNFKTIKELIAQKLPAQFTFGMFWEQVNEALLDTETHEDEEAMEEKALQHYEAVQKIVYKMLNGSRPFLKQIFNKESKEIVLELAR